MRNTIPSGQACPPESSGTVTIGLSGREASLWVGGWGLGNGMGIRFSLAGLGRRMWREAVLHRWGCLIWGVVRGSRWGGGGGRGSADLNRLLLGGELRTHLLAK